MNLDYLGGIFDGEGCVNLTHGRKRGRHQFYPAISVSNTDRRVLELLKNEFGGSVVENKRGVNYKVYNWYISNIKAANAAKILANYTMIKKDELLLLVEYHEEMRPLGYRQRILCRWDSDKADELQNTRQSLHEEYQKRLKDARSEHRNFNS